MDPARVQDYARLVEDNARLKLAVLVLMRAMERGAHEREAAVQIGMKALRGHK